MFFRCSGLVLSGPGAVRFFADEMACRILEGRTGGTTYPSSFISYDGRLSPWSNPDVEIFGYSSFPVSQTALNGWRRLVSARPATSCLFLLACVIKSYIEKSDAKVRAL
ncbi:unnamed protein product [Angiostrongylus costaricensis]|uniref:Secreted protein n=1 Tax=Angiostrongylus costaricensis TaxID=334426 RepID=A0A0R3PG56_ANGCS|nr:unnamed protein product [Angiostrongylus costaricensis]